MQTPHGQGLETDDRRLTRPLEGRYVAGVAAGAAEYFDLDVAMVRLAFVALAVLGGLAVPIYLAAWLLLPEEGSDVAIADEVLQRVRVR